MKFWIIDEADLVNAMNIEQERKEHEGSKVIRERYAKRQREYNERYIVNFNEIVSVANGVKFGDGSDS